MECGKFLVVIVFIACGFVTACTTDSKTQTETLTQMLATEDGMARLFAFRRIDTEYRPAERTVVLTRIWDSADQTNAGVAVRVSIIVYLIKRGTDAPGAFEAFAPRIAAAAREGPTVLRWSVLDYYKRRSPASADQLLPILDDPDDALRAETLATLWRMGARAPVRAYVARHEGDQSRRESLERAKFFIQRDR